jgi:hypothetical protein
MPYVKGKSGSKLSVTRRTSDLTLGYVPTTLLRLFASAMIVSIVRLQFARRPRDVVPPIALTHGPAIVFALPSLFFHRTDARTARTSRHARAHTHASRRNPVTALCPVA